MQPLRQHFQTQARDWWATPVVNQFLTLLGFILVVLFGVRVFWSGGSPGLDWGELLLPLYLICNSLNMILEANRMPMSERRRAGIWSVFAFSVLFLGWTLLKILSRP
ncbi:hypothetical protein [Deinococcus sp. QL22]|uniref:hypothetical protein n=1 Tax=Deinococcus sp. QL22 TaxID=2939437 RepID=UPI0020183889|nr:hypothetical protein [Deinococcus sp. QL22]UQN05485.1 hypothetical protein M1R55_11425 [Deinococcus sp. QL22]